MVAEHTELLFYINVLLENRVEAEIVRRLIIWRGNDVSSPDGLAGPNRIYPTIA